MHKRILVIIQMALNHPESFSSAELFGSQKNPTNFLMKKIKHSSTIPDIHHDFEKLGSSIYRVFIYQLLKKSSFEINE